MTGAGGTSRDVTRAWIALGSNLGRRREQLDRAVEMLRGSAGVEVLCVSPWIETQPVGGPAGQRSFWNGVLEAETTLAARALLELLLSIEARFGRVRNSAERNGPRTLDLDLLLFGNEEIEEDELIVPHPRMEDRIFVLEPMASIDPERRLARSGLSVSARLAELRRAGS